MLSPPFMRLLAQVVGLNAEGTSIMLFRRLKCSLRLQSYHEYLRRYQLYYSLEIRISFAIT